eukprot:TRINITY_DN5443_c0_g1_i1.p1 TRINITY_DN5443_c0_g1~~TRINITY_DN5443_c0_g1_i1.p1  ORF type:complete len:300 (+),score=68.98 TRINITY_DN5443_c0_g1_i1:26-925(+)
MSGGGCVCCGVPTTEHFLVAICGHQYCSTCKESRWATLTKMKCRAEGCEVTLGYTTFGWLNHSHLKPIELNTQSLDQIYCHTRPDFPSVDDYNRYLNEKYEMVFKLSMPKQTQAASEQVNKFAADHAESIGKKLAAPLTKEQKYKERYHYLAEEYKRLASRRVRKEQHLDEWCCALNIDREKFIESARAIEEDDDLERQKATYIINGEKKKTVNWDSVNCKPVSQLTQERLAAYQASAPSHPKPIKNENQNDLYQKWSEKVRKMPKEEKGTFLGKVKLAGGLRPDTQKEYTTHVAFACL